MDIQQAQLYQRIRAFSLDEPGAAYPFSQKLARENGWSADYTQRAIAEYQKFVFLAIAAGHPVSPSEVIDRVWHLHLTYTRSYWEEFCPKVLQTTLHHEPSRGGTLERQKFQDWHDRTLASYRVFFGQPPQDIWQSDPPRSRGGWLQQRWTIPFATLLAFWAATVGFPSPALAALRNPLNFKGPEFLAFYLWLSALSIFLAAGVRWYLRQRQAWQTAKWLPASLVWLMLPLGIAKMAIGIFRDKPIGWLLILCIIVAIIGFSFLNNDTNWSTSSRRSRYGSSVRSRCGTSRRSRSGSSCGSSSSSSCGSNCGSSSGSNCGSSSGSSCGSSSGSSCGGGCGGCSGG
ncbi:MAG TPA: hypothetical protein IGS17_12940 [Oscillatoriales cyanobacterium M59_W2019_021]|nr:hypothetical protein [Oscillatoriales cyanobacterium M4454_W2019_049]HIK51810.1 hypothetical protein [Oscillatoriales cyanobacterium M59_W2019_021]